MHPARARKQSLRAMTLVEVVVVMFIIAFLVTRFLPALRPPKSHASRVNCVNNLKQIGLAFQVWSNEHEEDKFPMPFPMALSTNKHGTLEFANSREVFRHFQTLSNELGSTKVLVCGDDAARRWATNWQSLSDSNLSYFVGLDADRANPQTILSGDRNITTNGLITSGILMLATNSPVSWAKSLHVDYGHIGLTDGSVQRFRNAFLEDLFQRNTNWPVRLAIP